MGVPRPSVVFYPINFAYFLPVYHPSFGNRKDEGNYSTSLCENILCLEVYAGGVFDGGSATEVLLGLVAFAGCWFFLSPTGSF